VGYPAFQKGVYASRLVRLATAMNSQAVTTVLSTRCSHRTTTGRQCRQLSADLQSGLCSHHRALQKQKEAVDPLPALLSQSQGFQTAQGVNFALTNLYELLAANRISPRAPPFSPTSTASSSAPSPPSTPTTKPASPIPPPPKSTKPTQTPPKRTLKMSASPHLQPTRPRIPKMVGTPPSPNPTPLKNPHDHRHLSRLHRP
jgi:hypothetical protein